MLFAISENNYVTGQLSLFVGGVGGPVKKTISSQTNERVLFSLPVVALGV